MAHPIATDTPGLATLVIDRDLPGLPGGLGSSPGPIRADAAAKLPPPPREGLPAELPVRWLFYSSGATADPKAALRTDASLWATA